MLSHREERSQSIPQGHRGTPQGHRSTPQGYRADPIGTVQGLFVPCLAIAWDHLSEVVADKMSPPSQQQMPALSTLDPAPVPCW